MRKFIALLGLLVSLGLVQAQTACPTGVAAGSAQCGPSPEYHGVGTSSASDAYQQPITMPIVRKQKWADRWGTIAYDDLNPIIGTVSGMKNKRIAENAALSQCRSKGGQKCKVAISYHNGCAALLAVHGGGLVTGGGATLERALELGREQCKDDAKECSVFYSNCSMAEEYWVRQ